ncbi:MAG: hypothetical protein J6S67_08135 [Methanobrevibacter sp.]|nr:hypothetical protein [Methanobrevibacter sp.]
MPSWGTFEQRSRAAKKGWATRRQRGVESWGTFEQRSRAAKKGWATRRQRGVESGTYTEEEFQAKYGHSSQEKVSDWFDEYDVYEDEPNNEPENNTENNEEEQSEDEAFDIGENEHRWLYDKVAEYTGIAPLMAGETLSMLLQLRSADQKQYYKNIVDNHSELDGCFKERTINSNTYEVYVAYGKIIEIASGGDISAKDWETSIKSARREDAFLFYHKTHPNAGYGKRRTSDYYK